MPWSQTTPMDQKTQFIADYLRKRLSITELCELYGISRKRGGDETRSFRTLLVEGFISYHNKTRAKADTPAAAFESPRLLTLIQSQGAKRFCSCSILAHAGYP